MRLFQRPVTEVMVKPAGPDCNLACDYCYYTKKLDARNRPTRMREAALEAMIRQLMAQNVPHLSIGWQGGEPTLMGLPFYRRAVELMARYGRGQSVANGFQTNGVLIDREWAQFLREYRFLVGLSIDGPQAIHDHHRRDRGGHGSWRGAVDAAKRLLDHGVEVSVLTVVTDHSVRHVDEIYAFHKSQGLTSMQFIPCVEREGTGVAGFSVGAVAYGEFLKRLFDLWRADFVADVPTTSIRWFEALLFRYAGRPPTECTLQKRCGETLVIEHTGDLYPCDFFVEPGWRLGNLLETPLPALADARRRRAFGRLKAALPAECRRCEWKAHCRGGCTKDRWSDPPLDGQNYLCPTYRRFFAHADAHLRRLADEWR